MCLPVPRHVPVESLQAFVPKSPQFIFAKRLDVETLYRGVIFPAPSYAVCDLDGNIKEVVQAEEFESRTKPVEGNPLTLTARNTTPPWLQAP